MATTRRDRRRDTIGSLGDMEYLDASGLWVPASGSKTVGYVPTIQGDGTVAFAASAGSSPAWVTNHPDTPPTNPTLFSGVAYDLEFMRDNALTTGTTIGSPATAPAIVDRRLKLVSGTSASADVKGREWVCPGSAFTMTAKVQKKLSGNTFGATGIMLRRNASSTGNFIALWNVLGGAFVTMNFEVDKYTTETARSSSGSSSSWGGLLWLPIYMRWAYDGTNIASSFSFSGNNDSFIPVLTETAATFLGGAPGRFGFIMDNFGTTANSAYCEWIRFT